MYNMHMRRSDFQKDIDRMLATRPSRNMVKVGKFGPFSFKKPYTVYLPASVIDDYSSYILDNFESFEEDIRKQEVEESPVLYSLSHLPEKDEKKEKKEFSLFQSAPSESVGEPPYECRDFFETSPAGNSGKSVFDDIRKTVISESFSDMLIRLQNERNVTAPALYKAAGIDYRHYSKIISDRNYKPKKDTALALAIALKLSLPETDDFVGRAGYTFSPSSLFDMTVKYFIQKGIYDRNTIDLLMDSMNLPLLQQNWDVRHL